MNLTYETDRLLLRLLNENNSAQVLSFLSRNREYFDRYELEKSEQYYTEAFQKNLLHEEFHQALKGNRLRFYFFRKHNSFKAVFF